MWLHQGCVSSPQRLAAHWCLFLCLNPPFPFPASNPAIRLTSHHPWFDTDIAGLLPCILHLIPANRVVAWVGNSQNLEDWNSDPQRVQKIDLDPQSQSNRRGGWLLFRRVNRYAPARRTRHSGIKTDHQIQTRDIHWTLDSLKVPGPKNWRGNFNIPCSMVGSIWSAYRMTRKVNWQKIDRIQSHTSHCKPILNGLLIGLRYLLIKLRCQPRCKTSGSPSPSHCWPIDIIPFGFVGLYEPSLVEIHQWSRWPT